MIVGEKSPISLINPELRSTKFSTMMRAPEDRKRSSWQELWGKGRTQSPLACVWLGMRTEAVSCCVRCPKASRMPLTTQLAAKTPSPTAATTVEKSTSVATNAFNFGPLSFNPCSKFAFY